MASLNSILKPRIILGLSFIILGALIYFKTTQYNCQPINLKAKSTGKTVEISWNTTKPCDGYIKYKNIKSNNLQTAWPSDRLPTKKHSVKIDASEPKLLEFYIVSGNKTYGYKGEAIKLNELIRRE